MEEREVMYSTNENIDEIKNTFDLLLQDAQLKDYLKADPQQAGERTELSRAMSIPFFFEYFYCPNENADKLIEEYRHNIQYENKKNIVLHGYEGCGKTTFINYWMNKDNHRHVLLTFDSYIRTGDELKAIIVSNIYDAINDDVYDNNGIVIRKILEIFTTEYNLRCMARNDIQNNFMYMFDKFKYVLKLLEDRNKRSELDTYLLKDIKDFMVKKFIISELMLFMVIWDIGYKRVNNLQDTCYFIFENLDTLYESVGLQELVTQIGIFRNNADHLFLQLKENDRVICNPSKEYICIFVMRDTTKAVFNEHMNSQKVSLYIPEESLTFNCRIDKVIEKKANYLEKLKTEKPHLFNDNCRQLLNGIRRIQEILSDEYVTDTIFTLFNNNFRKEFEILADIHIDNDKLYVPFINLCEADKANKGNWSRYGARCILFRNIFDLLEREHFFDILKKSDYEKYVGDKKYAINLSRLILLYLQNSYNKPVLLHSNVRETDFVSLEMLASEMLKICDDENELARALWEMYQFRQKNNWNHLVTFDQMHVISRESILKQIQAVKHKDYSSVVFGKIRITLAGVTYLEKVLTHFEYFVARNEKNVLPSLFVWKLSDILHVDTLENYLSITRKEITDCCDRLMCFNEEFLSKIPDYKGNNFLNSKFAHRKYYDDGSYKSMYHCERIVHSQVTYLDAFRKYCFYLVDNCTNNELLKMDGLNISRLIKLVLNIVNSQRYFTPVQFSSLKNSNSAEYIFTWNENNKGILYENKKTKREEMVHFSKEEICRILKIALNRILVNKISQYISMFGLKNASDRKTSISKNTEYLASCYTACVGYLYEKGFDDFEIEINRENGNELLKRN